ncbi:MAG: transketolase [Actinomycetota bacterium]|nr:transketolase [Actinomycetota bacterium]
MDKDIEQLAVDSIRALSIDAIQKANSGHPGAPMGMADMAVVLWSKFLRVDPQNPTWENRDRFVLSAGHASMLLYSLLHLAGFPITMEDIKQFRQWGSVTAGHPEIDIPLGIEMTTGPLGQGFATGAGMAIAEAHLSDRFGRDLVNHRTYGFVSDGDLMEGVASEAASLAGHLGLGKLIYLYDDNGITLTGPTSWSYTEDAARRFDAYGWQTMTIDGHDRGAVADAIAAGIADESRPTLISCKTHIGYGSPSKQDTASAHGSPLGDDEIALVKEKMGWEYESFHVPSEVYSFFTASLDDHRQERSEWERRLEMTLASDHDLGVAWKQHFDPASAQIAVPLYDEGAKVATRAISGTVINALAADHPEVIGGSADLASSTSTLIKSSTDFSATDRAGRNIRFGVREHGMGAITNGINIHGGLRGFGATFLTFADYMRGAVRLGALTGTPSTWVFTHDSIFLGEDGPTHQPVEHVASLRTIPNLWVLRPATAAEVAGSWEVALNRTEGPTALILTRQGVPVGDPTPVPVAKGAYVAREGGDAVVVATGSELSVALDAALLLAEDGKSVRVVSMPCVEAFVAQGDEYRSSILGDGLPIASIEAGVTYGWGDIIGKDGLAIGIDRFGASAPAAELAEQFGLTPARVAAKLSAWLG